jgi:hypothetical protein
MNREHAGNGGRPVRRLWARAWAASAAATAFGCLYFFVRQYFKDGTWAFDLGLVNKSLGVAALFLLSLSMFLTGVAYFSNGSARILAFRKHYGLVGFWTGLVHGAVNHFLLPLVGIHAERKVAAWISDGPALAALVLFGVMAWLSDPRSKERLGGPVWRRTLRYAGYVGLGLSIGHTALLKGASWAKYFRTFSSVIPSLSLPVAVFAAAAIILRLAVWVSQRRDRS